MMIDSKLPTFAVKDLMEGGSKILLLHHSKSYLLSITRRGKLILTLAESSKK